ncbi:MAG: zinc-ribbon domain-containing protein [Alphaproteobacteria bacterium]|nr:zinc-ribbon domain-containing protein [Alphaproteobacteria bacterium]OJV14073.1 MAG: hypothetical protein BGO27_01125 [Alphaproteobacteria bacterium 33-17]
MIVTCPSCFSRFSLDNNILPPRGRKVRCSKCKNEWHQEHPDFSFTTAKKEEINIDKFIKDPGEGKLGIPTKALIIQYIPKIVFFFIGVIMLSFTMLIFYRDNLGLTAKFEGFYDSIGYSNTTSMKFADLTIQKTLTTNGNFLVFSGNMINDSNKPVDAVFLRVTIKDRNNNELVKQIFPYTGAKYIEPGESIDIKFPMKIWFNPELMNFVELDIASKLEFAIGLR